MASITERRNRDGDLIGWQARVRRAGVVSVKTFDRKTDAERWARQTETEIEQGVFVDRTEAERNSLEAILTRYRDEVCPDKRGGDREKSMLNVIIRSQPALVRTRMTQLSARQFADWRKELVADEYAPATIVRQMNLVATIINHARREWGINVAENVAGAKLVARPKRADRARDRRLREGEEEKLFAELGKSKLAPYLAPLARLAIETACRQGELCSLRWSDIDLKRRVATIRGLSGEGSKNGEIRDIPLSTIAVEAIQSLPRDIKDGRLFRLDQNSLKLAYRRAVERAGIDDLTFHDLRHEATSRLAATYTNPLELMRITGHKTLSMLARYYHADAAELAKRLA
jgi:integrase